jgi:hypothetical protein
MLREKNVSTCCDKWTDDSEFFKIYVNRLMNDYSKQLRQLRLTNNMSREKDTASMIISSLIQLISRSICFPITIIQTISTQTHVSQSIKGSCLPPVIDGEPSASALYAVESTHLPANEIYSIATSSNDFLYLGRKKVRRLLRKAMLRKPLASTLHMLIQTDKAKNIILQVSR